VGPAQARNAALLLLTLRGTPTLYYGDELGLTDVVIPPDQVQDPRELREPGHGFGRDPVRTPMPWDRSPHAGFTTGDPWLPLNADWPVRNVAAQSDEAGSMLALHRQLLHLRRAHPALAVGSWELIEAEGDVLAYERRYHKERIVVALNLGDKPHRIDLPEGRLLLTSVGDYVPGGLAPDQGVILEVAA
jgi:alpha-glucosidase